MFITSGRVKFIDFEDASINPAGNEEHWDKRKADEMESLAESLSDTSGKGRLWSV